MGNNALVTLGSFARPVAPQRHITCLGDNRVRWRSVAVGRSVRHIECSSNEKTIRQLCDIRATTTASKLEVSQRSG